jgi:hypothetical protein
MLRRLLTLVLAASIAFAGNVPAMAMTVVADAPTAVQSAAETPDSDCMKAMAAANDDCCKKQDQGSKSKCLFDDACAARCHVNAAVLYAPLAVPMRLSITRTEPLAAPRPLYAERPGPHYRPPIV